MYYVYVLKSLKDGKFYTGSTNNLKLRLKEHNSGSEKSTSYRKPFKLVYYESCLNRRDALRREMYLKTNKGRTTLMTMLQDYFIK